MRVLYVQYTNPAGYPPIEHGALLLAEGGAEVRLLGTRREADPLELVAHPHVRVHYLPFEPAGWRQKLHYLRFALQAWWTILTWRPTWIYASDPLSCPLVLFIGPERVVYHEHDSPEGRPSGAVARLATWARRRVARRAACCVLPNPDRAERLASDVGRSDVLTVWNCPLRRDVRAARDRAVAAPLRLMYHGSIVPARLPLVVVEALALVSARVELVIAGYETIGHPGYLDALLARADGLGVRDRVDYVGTIPQRDRLLDICASCHVGLALMPLDATDTNEQAMVGASNKPFDYMACGLGLIVSERGDWRSAFVEPGFGWACDPTSAASLAALVQRLLETPDELSATGARNRAQILASWNYETTFEPVLTRLAGSPSASRVELRTAAS